MISTHWRDSMDKLLKDKTGGPTDYLYRGLRVVRLARGQSLTGFTNYGYRYMVTSLNIVADSRDQLKDKVDRKLADREVA